MPCRVHSCTALQIASARGLCNGSSDGRPSVEEIAGHLGVKPTSIYKWITRKGMPAHKLGRLWKFKIDEVDGWIRSGKAAQMDSDK